MSFTDANLKVLEKKVLTLLNREKKFLTKRTTSTRSIGDALENIVQDKLPSLLGKGIKNYFSGYEPRAMEDLSFYDAKGNYYAVDVKSHNLSRAFTMPNLISVRRLSDFYEGKNNHFMVLMISYIENKQEIEVKKVIFRPIEHFDWSCLQVVNLGWGQLQIKDSNAITIKRTKRINWLVELLDNVDVFYKKEIEKIKNTRIGFFKKKRRAYLKIYK